MLGRSSDSSLRSAEDIRHARLEALAQQLFGSFRVGIAHLRNDGERPVAGQEDVSQFNEYSCRLGRGIEIEDALLHPEFSDQEEIRFFANRLIRSENGTLAGSLYVCDALPHRITEDERGNLDLLGSLAQDLLGVGGSASGSQNGDGESLLQTLGLDFKTIFHGSREPMCLLSYPEMKFVELNLAAEELIGRPSSSILGTRFGELTDGYATGEFPRLLNQLKGQGRTGPVELTFDTLAERRVVIISGQVVESSGLKYALLISQDITDQVNLLAREQQRAAELEVARRDAEAANRAKSAFLARMSHELRTPLNSIMGFTKLLASDAETTESQRETLSFIDSSGNYLLGMINDVLEMSKIEAGQSELRLTSVSLHALIDELEHIFRPLAEKKSLQLRVAKGANLPSWIISDLAKLRQILTNLLSNAIKFTNEGEVAIELVARPGNRLFFKVSDTGIGIAPSELAHLFEAFGQTHCEIHGEEGAGLGLAISKAFVELLGGDLSVTSQPGMGSQVSFEIPWRDAEAVQKKSPITVGNVRGVHGQRKPRILVVDDHPVNRLVLNGLFKKVGFDVDEAENGLEAVNRMNEDAKPDLVLMDIRMPVMDGLEATRTIRAQGGDLAQVGVFALTGNAYDEDRQTALEAGCNAFLPKPIDMDELLQRIATNLGIEYDLADTVTE